MTPNPDIISRAEADRQIQEAVAAALMEAADLVDALSDGILDGAQACAETHPAFSADRQEHAEDARQVAVRIRALITENAQTALTKPPQMLSRRRASMSNDLVKRLRKQSSAGRVNHVSKADRLAAADRIEELEAANRGLVRLNETTEARAEAAETLLSEVVRALINIERIYYMEAANPDPATIRRMAAQMNGVANTVLSSLSLESEEVARIMMTQAVRETQE